MFNPSDTTFEHHDANIIAARGFYYYDGRDEGSRINQIYGDTRRLTMSEQAEVVARVRAF